MNLVKSIIRILILCVTGGLLLGCSVKNSGNYVTNPNQPTNKDYLSFKERQIKVVNSFEGEEMKRVIRNNRALFEGNDPVPDGQGGLIYTLKVRPYNPFIKDSKVNPYGSREDILIYNDLVFTLFVNKDGIVEEVANREEVYDLDIRRLLSEKERELRKKADLKEALIVACLPLVLTGAVLIAFYPY